MKVVEIFNSIDGEGKRAGELTTFIRFWGCNLRCDWCDTPYSYEKQGDDKAYTEMSINEIINKCVDYRTRNITVTGGEPLIQDDIDYLLRALSDKGFDVNVETNGSININKYFEPDGNPKQDFKNVWFTVDYKCPSSKINDRMCMDNFNTTYNAHYNTVYKFVVGSKEDLDTACEVIGQYINTGDTRNKYIYFSPVFGSIEPKEIVEFMQKKLNYCYEIPVRVQLQLHKFIWPVDQRGV